MTSSWRHYQRHWQNSHLLETKQNIYHSKGIEELSKMCFLLNLSHCVKSYGHFIKCWLLLWFRSPNMVMSCDQRCKFRNFLFCLNSTFNIRKSHKISSGKAPCFRSYQQGGWWKTPIPSVFRVNTILIVQVLMRIICRLLADLFHITGFNSNLLLLFQF